LINTQDLCYATIVMSSCTVANCNVIFTGRMPQRGKLPVLNLLTHQKSGFSPRRGDSLHRLRSNFAGPTGTWVRLAVQNFTSIGTGGGGIRPQNIKKFHFLVKSRLAVANPLTDL